MKRLLLILLLIAPPLLSQTPSAARWGGKFLFGTAFKNTDSLQITASSVRDTLLGDTLYTSVLPMPDQDTRGVWRIASYFNELSSEAGAVDSITVEVRDYVTFSYPSTRSIVNLWGSLGDKPASRGKFGAWQKIWPLTTPGTLHKLNIAQSDSTWFGPANGQQFRAYVRDTSTDTLLHDIGDFLD